MTFEREAVHHYIVAQSVDSINGRLTIVQYVRPVWCASLESPGGKYRPLPRRVKKAWKDECVFHLKMLKACLLCRRDPLLTGKASWEMSGFISRGSERWQITDWICETEWKESAVRKNETEKIETVGEWKCNKKIFSVRKFRMELCLEIFLVGLRWSKATPPKMTSLGQLTIRGRASV